MKLPLVPSHWAEKWAWILLFALAWVAGFHLSLWDQDEAAYAGFAWNMQHTGNWLIPDFLWSEIHRKPPLLFWSIAVAYDFFGVHEWVIRLPSLLALLGTVLLVRYQAAISFGVQVARIAAWLLAANIFLPHLAKLGVTDALLLFFETLAVLSLINYFHIPKLRYQLLFVVGTAAAMLVKGPPVLILTFGILGLILLFSPERKTILRFHPWFLFPLAALPLFLWGRLAWLNDDGVLISWMIDWYTLRRVGSDVLGQTGPPGYHFLVMAIGFLPALAFLPGAFTLHIKQLLGKSRPFKSFVLLAWAISGWVIYEFMKSKLPTYAIGAYPAIAIMLATYLGELPSNAVIKQRRLVWGTVLYLLLSVLLAVAIPFLAKAPVNGQALFPEVAIKTAYWMAFCLVVPALLAAWLLYKSHYAWALRTMFLQSVLFLVLAWQLFVPTIEPKRSAGKQVAEYAALNSFGLPVILTANFELPSIPFYLVAQRCRFQESPELTAWLPALENRKQLLIFNSGNIDQLKIIATEAGLGYRIEKEIPGFISDRGKFTTWYIVRGQRAFELE